MDIVTVIIQAVVQGLTEFLPVSSSGHLSVVQHITGVDGEAALILSLVLHLGTLAAVFIAFWGTIWGMIKEFFLTIRDIFTGKFSWKNMNGNRRMMFMVIIATVILVPFYLVQDFFTGRQGDGDIVFEGVAFMFTALLLFLSDRFGHGTRTAEDMTVKDAVTVGLFQVVALFPGVSRSGSTTAGGLLSGLEKQTAVTFAFILGIPAILGGSVLELGDALKSDMELDWVSLGIGFVIAAFVGILSIKLVSWLVKKDRYKIFGVYTAVLGAACVAAGLWEHITGNTLASLFVG
ncbi:MAG: undecaprenyl-diphosphate phosphatase [Ruminococcaceae bacterium]|jgi:undecaprenyl-diphosphatase|nr:undecaprenyl-diphosphate phosphatase [Oscillospiraceae bacterium]